MVILVGMNLSSHGRVPTGHRNLGRLLDYNIADCEMLNAESF